MNEPTMAELAQLVRSLSERVDQLERRAGRDGGIDHTLLERLAPPRGDDTEDASPVTGGLTYAGSLQVRGEPVVWQRNHDAVDLTLGDADRLAGLLAAVSHPVRVRVLQRLCGGSASAAQLLDTLQLSSTGKLYHHLDKLTAAGWVRSAGRGVWKLAPEAIVPTLILLAAADDVGR